MNWFQRHLNWTAVLSWLAVYPISPVIIFILGLEVTRWYVVVSWLSVYPVVLVAGFILEVTIRYLVWRNASLESLLIFGYLSGIVATLAWLLSTNGWILKKKGRSLWHLIWLFVPLAIGVFLSLENKNKGKPQRTWAKLGLVSVGFLPILAAVVIIPNVGRLFVPYEMESARIEEATIQMAVITMMVDNGLTALPNRVTVPTKDMGAFPDMTPAVLKGNSFTPSDKAGFILYQHDKIGDGRQTDLVDYITTQYTRYYYSVNAFGTVTQMRPR